MFLDTLQPLFESLRREGIESPVYFFVGEIGSGGHDERGYPVFHAAELIKAQNYDERFSFLLNEGYPWINVSYYGNIRGLGLIAIELPGPQRKDPKFVGKTSVNVSGPSKRVLERGGDTEPYIVLDGPCPA
jgi:hypothetical protein